MNLYSFFLLRLYLLVIFSILIPSYSTAKETQEESASSPQISIVMSKKELQTILDESDDLPAVMMALKLLADDAQRNNEPAPKYNLCRFTNVDNTMLCEHNKGIPRIKMPQIISQVLPGGKADKLIQEGILKPDPQTKEVSLRDHFITWLTKEKHFKVSKPTMVSARSLKATQSELLGDKVAGIWWKYKQHPEAIAQSEPIFVSNDHFILDGHHRWAAVLATSYGNEYLKDVDMPVYIVDIDINTLLKETEAFIKEYGLQAQAGL